MATVMPPTPIRDATPEEARIIVAEQAAYEAYRGAARFGDRAAVGLAESRWRCARAIRERRFAVRVGWYRIGPLRFGYHDFRGAGLEWGSKPV